MDTIWFEYGGKSDSNLISIVSLEYERRLDVIDVCEWDWSLLWSMVYSFFSKSTALNLVKFLLKLTENGC